MSTAIAVLPKIYCACVCVCVGGKCVYMRESVCACELVECYMSGVWICWRASVYKTACVYVCVSDSM